MVDSGGRCPNDARANEFEEDRIQHSNGPGKLATPITDRQVIPTGGTISESLASTFLLFSANTDYHFEVHQEQPSTES